MFEQIKRKRLLSRGLPHQQAMTYSLKYGIWKTFCH